MRPTKNKSKHIGFARVVQEILGRSDVALTLNRYTRALKSTAHEQMEKMNELFRSMDFIFEKSKERNDPERDRSH
jgi:hypothetical protein